MALVYRTNLGVWQNTSNELFTNLLLYGSLTTPLDLNDRIRPVVDSGKLPHPAGSTQQHPKPDVEIIIQIDEASFMASGPGRFANASRMGFVTEFFTASESHIFVSPSGQYIYVPEEGVSYTVIQLRAMGFEGFSESLYQANWYDGVGSDDYELRVYSYLSQSFSLNSRPDDQAVFFFHRDPALREIRNFKLEANHEDFDFEGTTNPVLAQLAESIVDPYGLGRNPDGTARSVGIEYTRNVDPRTYRLADFQADQNRSDQLYLDPIDAGVTGALAMNDVYSDLVASGTIEYERDGYQIIYGTAASDPFLSVLSNEVLLQASVRPSIIIGGPGSDTFIGAQGVNEQLLGGDYDDVSRYSDPAYDKHRNDVDTVDYRHTIGVDLQPNTGTVTIRLGEGERASEGVVTVDDDDGGTDLLEGIERIVGTDQSDRVIIKGLLDEQLDQIDNIDGAGQEQGSGADVLDFAALGRSVYLRGKATAEGVEILTGYTPPQSTAQFILNMFIPTGSTTGGGLSGATGLAFTDFEHVIGSAYDDVLALWELAPGGALSAADRATIEALLATPIGGFGDPVAVAAATNALVEAARLIPQNQQDVLIEAGDGRDIVIGTETGTNRIYGGDGVDLLYAGGFTSELHGGAETDFLQGGGFESQLYGGEGADLFGLAHHTFVEDATSEDHVVWGSFHLTGGVKQWWMETGWAYYTPFTSVLNASPLGFLNSTFSAVFTMLDVGAMQTFRYALSESGQLIIQYARGRGGQAVIEGYTNAEQGFDLDGADFVGNIAVFQQEIVEGGRLTVADLEHYVALALKAGFGVGIDGTDPLVLDLDGDGLELYRRDTANVYFDLDQDGFAERTAWVRPDDGLLARDLNANGIIDNVSELFGDATTPGFDALATLDSNADGIISAADVAFGELRVWRDADSDGVTDAGELMTLAEAGITEISLANAMPQAQGLRGSTIRAEGTFTRADGSTSVIADVALLNSDTDTRYLGDTTVSATAATLPELAGSGNMTGLRIAMTNNAALLAEVEAFAGLTGISSWQALEDSVADILFRWAGVDGLPSTPLADGLDAQMLAFLETYLGYELAPRDIVTGAPLVVNAAELQQAWDDILTAATARLAAQGPLAAMFPSLAYNDSLDGFHLPSASALADIFAAALAALPADPAAAETAWADLYGPAIGALLSSVVRHDGVDVRADYAVQSLATALDGVATPLSLDTLVAGLGLKNVHIGTSGADALVRDEASGTHVYFGGAGNDALTGGVGQDVYVFGTGFGTDTVIDSEPGGRESGDRLRFATLSADEVTLTKSGTDLVVLVNGTTDKVIVKDYFAAPTVTLGGGQLTPDYGIEEIQFADGTILEAGDVAARVGLGTAGNDVIEGSGIADEIEGLQGDDVLRGGDGGDLYYFTRGDGHDAIEDIMANPLLSAPDTLLLTGNIALDDLRLTRSEEGAGDDLTIGFTWGGDSITIVDQFAYSPLGFDSQFALDNRIEALFFDRGTPIDWLTLQAITLAAYTSSGDDTTTGFGTPDELFASAGNDLLVGLDGGDTYHFGLGSGQDTISDSARYVNTPFSAIVGGVDNGNDRLVFGDGIAVSDVVFSRPGGTDDLLITLANASDSIVIRDQFSAVKLDLMSLLGVAWFDRIEAFQFADGTVLTWEEVLLQLTTGTASADTLYGAYYQDTLDGKEGDDWLSGGDEGDTYIFGRGYGNDVIEDNRTNVLTATADTVAFKADIAFADAHFERDGTTDDLLITFTGSSDTLRITNQYVVTETGPFGAHGFDTIERFTWTDGTVKEWTDLAAEIIAAQKTTGSDVILGTHFDDVLDGGAGDDTLIGGNGSDTYVINVGDGHDVVSDQMVNILSGDGDILSFGAGLLASDLIIERAGVDLADARLTFASIGQSVVLEGQFFYTTINYRPGEIETIAFADGTTWTAADLRGEYLSRITTTGADTIEGFYSDDVIVGGAGNDALRGGDGSDRYLFEVGFGQDVIEEGVDNVAYPDNDMVEFGAGLSSTDAVLSRSGDDLRISFTGLADQLTIAGQFSHGGWYPGFSDIELFQFDDGVTWTDLQVRELLISQSQTSGDDTITGFWTADVIDGGAGNDMLQGLGGGDTYVFGIGSGQDTIDESVATPFEDQPDTVTFLPTVTPGDVSFAHVGDDLRITIANATDTLTVVDHFSGSSRQVELFKFSDGTILTAADVAAGSTQSQSTSGDDTVTGTAANDLIDGGLGNDTLRGGDGSDTYHFGAGFGQDTIEESVVNAAISDADTVTFGGGYSSQAAMLSRSGNDLIIGFVGSTDQLVVAGQFAHNAWYPGRQDIELFQFADGTQWTDADIRRMLIGQSQTPGDDVVTGFWTDETLDGGAGNDVLRGLGGGDTYLFGRGSGQDTIEESYATVYEDLPDTVLFGDGLTASDLHFLKAGNDLLVSLLGAADTLTITNQFDGTGQHAVEIFAFSDGTSITSEQVRVLAIAAQATDGDDTVTGTDADDVLTGGLGNDLLEGDDGKDRYLFGASFGSDIIAENPTMVPLDDADSVEFAFGYDLDLAQFTRVGDDLIITFTGLPDQLTVQNQFLQTAWYEPMRDIEIFTFGDGATLTDGEVRDLLLAQAQTAGADVVTGYWTNDLIDGGTGNDTLRGLEGDDTYVFGRGYGADVIEDDNSWVAGSLSDRVLFKADVVPGDVEIARVGSDLVLSIAGTSDSLTIKNQFASGGHVAIESFEFADGTVWSLQDVKERLLAGTPAGETLLGFQTSDTLDGRAGNDLLKGLDGGDTYVFGRDYGQDVIDDGATNVGITDPDTVRFSPTVGVGDVEFRRLGDDLGIVIAGTSDVLTIKGHFKSAQDLQRIETFAFADGTTLSYTEVNALADAVGPDGVNRRGTVADDAMHDTAGADTFAGGLGNDTINSTGGSDTYQYVLGDGSDLINERNGTAGELDRLELADINASDIELMRNGQDLAIQILATGDVITVDDQFSTSGANPGIDEIRFADGTIWDRADIANNVAILGTSADDVLAGTSNNERFYGLGGNDVIDGKAGSDTYVFRAGDATTSSMNRACP